MKQSDLWQFRFNSVQSLSRVHLFATPWTILQARILEWVFFPLLQGIFPTQGLNLGLPHCRWILYRLSHQDKGFSVNLGTLFIP